MKWAIATAAVSVLCGGSAVSYAGTCGAATRWARGLLNFVNLEKDNTPGRLGPRSLTFARQEGKVVGPTSRVWITRIPYDLDDATLALEKTGGKGRVDITVCKHPAVGAPSTLADFEVSGGDRAPKDLSRQLGGLKDTLVSVHFQGKSVTSSFQYRIRLKRPTQGKRWKATRNALGPVVGFADTHLHQGSDLAFGGAWMWGNHDGELKACTGRNHAAPHGKRTEPYKHWPHYSDGAHQQAGAKELEQAWKKGLRLAVVTAENNQALCGLMFIHGKQKQPCNDMDSVKIQLRAFHAFAKKHSWYRIARDPWEARQIIHDGHLAVVLAVEISNLMPESQGNWRDQLDELYDMGVRSFELAHESDSRFSGSAQHHGGTMMFANWLKRADESLVTTKPWQSLQNLGALFKKTRKDGVNSIGLKPEGKELLAEMVNRKILIPLDHISRKARDGVYEEIANNHAYYPLFATHSRFDAIMHPYDKEHATQEYMLSDENAAYIRDTGGTFGLRTGPNPMVQVEGCTQIACWGSSQSLAQNVCWADKLGIALTMGTDLSGGPFEHTAPRFASAAEGVERKDGLPPHCVQNIALGQPMPDTKAAAYPKGLRGPDDHKTGWGFDVRGLAHVGYEKDLIEDMRSQGAPVTAVGLGRSAETFLRMWNRAYDEKRTKLSPAAYGKQMGLRPTGTVYTLGAPLPYDKQRIKDYKKR